MRTLHVAAAQIHSGGGIPETLWRAERQIRAAASVGVEVILFSEAALQGYDYDLVPEGLARVAESADGPAIREILRLARHYDLAIAMGFFEQAGTRYFNSVVVAQPDGSIEVARKHALTRREREAGLTPGPRRPTVVAIKGVRIAIVICSDAGIPGLHEDLRRRRADYRFCPTAGGGRISEMLHEADLKTPEGRQRYEANRARVFKPVAFLGEKECPFTGFASANALGPVGRQTCHQGHCMIVDNNRTMRAQIPGTCVLEHMQDQMIHVRLTFE